MSALMGWMSRFSFHRRLQFSFLILILLPFMAVTLWSYTSVKQNVTDRTLRSNEETLRVIANQLTKTIDTISFASIYFSQSYDAEALESLRYLKDKDSFTDYEAYARHSKLKSMANILTVQSFDANLEILIVNRKNRIVMGNLDRPLFSELPDGFLAAGSRVDDSETSILQWFPSGSGDAAPAHYYAARVIADPRNSEKLATLFIGIPNSYFQSVLNTGNPAVAVTLTDKSGSRIASANEIGDLSGADVLSGEVRIPRVDWQLASHTLRSSIVGQINREFFVSIMVVGIFFVGFLVLSVLWAGQINKPLSLLRSNVKQYVGGNRNVRLPVKGKDEVAQLSSAFNQMLDELNQLLHQVETEQEEKRKLELQALAAQISPHFLLNTLNSIKVNLLLAGDSAHGGMLESLIKLLRAYVRVEPVGLAEECKVLGSYIQVMQIRNRLDIRFHSRIGAQAEAIRLPRLLLQPIVENAIIHGFSSRPENPAIELSAEWTGAGLRIEIGDNGRGMPDERLKRLNDRLDGIAGEESPASGRGVGMVNVARRLRILYGPLARLSAANRSGGGLAVVFFIPMTLPEEAASDDIGHVD
ncbi:sensor histidine kinase [Cohnella massiliensis]|uniref:sensor histidine kinase n=1 Tax=Cohnella massiliensis TaxID=1816691 RepID=UPI0009BC5830|nr:histidine kinase [Cohnella massiliensis]